MANIFAAFHLINPFLLVALIIIQPTHGQCVITIPYVSKGINHQQVIIILAYKGSLIICLGFINTRHLT